MCTFLFDNADFDALLNLMFSNTYLAFRYKGGRFLFLDHVSYPRSYWSATVQKFINPLWKVYLGGCELTRHIGDEIQKAGFSDVVYENTYPKSVILLNRPNFYGIATK